MYLLLYIYMLDIPRGSWKRLSLNFNEKKKKKKMKKYWFFTSFQYNVKDNR